MRGRAIMVCLVATACGSPREHAKYRGPITSPDRRCSLRISEQGTFVDGQPMPRADAVAYCKQAPGGAVVVLEPEHQDPAKNTEWVETRSALEREGVRFYVRGTLWYDSPRRRFLTVPSPSPAPPPSK